jgi:hypothetical protein
MSTSLPDPVVGLVARRAERVSAWAAVELPWLVALLARPRGVLVLVALWLALTASSVGKHDWISAAVAAALVALLVRRLCRLRRPSATRAG